MDYKFIKTYEEGILRCDYFFTANISGLVKIFIWIFLAIYSNCKGKDFFLIFVKIYANFTKNGILKPCSL